MKQAREGKREEHEEEHDERPCADDRDDGEGEERPEEGPEDLEGGFLCRMVECRPCCYSRRDGCGDRIGVREVFGEDVGGERGQRREQAQARVIALPPTMLQFGLRRRPNLHFGDATRIRAGNRFLYQRTGPA